MTNPDDITAYLKAKLEDRNPKCANCRFWGLPGNTGHIRFCLLESESMRDPVMNGTVRLQSTLDLSLCSAWEKRET